MRSWIHPLSFWRLACGATYPGPARQSETVGAVAWRVLLSECQVDGCSLAPAGRLRACTPELTHKVLVVRRLAQQLAGNLAQPVDLLGLENEARGQVHEVLALLRVGDRVEADIEHLQADLRDARFGLRLAQPLDRRLGYPQVAPPLRDLRAILHQLDGFERVPIDRHARGLQELCDHAGRRFLLVPVGARGRAGVDDDQHDPADDAEADLALERGTRRRLLEHLQHAAHADVVGDAAVDEVDVRPVLAVLERLNLAVELNRARRRPRVAR